MAYQVLHGIIIIIIIIIIIRKDKFILPYKQASRTGSKVSKTVQYTMNRGIKRLKV